MKLTEKIIDKEDDISSIREIFDAANESVASATQIFNKCVALKNKLDRQKKELEKQRKIQEEKNNEEIESIKQFKDEAYRALKDKKKEINFCFS